MSTILFEVNNGLAKITLNRPDVYNSFNREMALELQARLVECHTSEDIRAVVLTGAGKAFCAGQDLSEAIDPEGPGIKRIVVEHFNPIVLQLRKLPKPVIAVVNGVAAGAGANLVFACDVAIAHENASFIQAFSKIGLIPDSGGTWTLPRLIGFQKASALMMLGDKVSAKDAEQMGMIYKWFPADAFEGGWQKIAGKLASMPTYGLGLTKMALNQTFEASLDQQLAAESVWQEQAAQSHDYKEGVEAFLEKRKPNFTGK
ncbi:MAG: enoyl-CoA hydratase-related protein [Verrucomicrobiota bacterium]